MTEADRSRYEHCMAILGEVYGALSALRLQAYWIGLGACEILDIEAAVLRCIRTRRSHDGYPAPWPTPGDLIALMYHDDPQVPDVGRTQRLCLPEAPPDPATAGRIRTMIRGVIESLPDFRPGMENPGVPKQQPGIPRSRQEILRETFELCWEKTGEFSVLALRAGYRPQDIAEAIQAVHPKPDRTEGQRDPGTEADQPW